MSSPLPSPFVGPRPFEAGETLYGRDREISELGDRLISERIVLLHSPSGAGKSSMVRAGLLPELRSSFDIWGPTRVNQEPAKGVLNRYVASAVQGFEQGIPERGRRSADVLAGQTLAEYFTGRPRRRKAPANVLLIFDQFEEVLTVDTLAVEAKEAFFDQLGELLRIPRAFALFVLREDYLAPLDPYSRRVPTHLRNRFRIELLGLDAAREAMVEPARTGGREFPAVDQLVHDLATRMVQRVDGSFEQQTGRHVEPVQLQVTCRRLWDAMPADDLSIDPEDVEDYGNVTEALGSYYADSVSVVAGGDISTERAGAAERAAAAERAVREWFDQRLITTGGIRGQVLREAGESGGLANELIEALRGTHLIRAEQRAGATWYELAHDRLVEPVQADNKAWRDEHLSAVQQRASLWERQERPPGLLMKDEELAKGERWAVDNKVGLTDVERRFLGASRKAQDAVEKERRQARRVRALAVVSLIVALLAGWQWWEADKQKQAAIAAQQRAERQARIATSGRLAIAATSDFLLSSLLASQSWDFADTFGAKRALLTNLQSAPRWKATLRLPDLGIHSAFSPDGKTLAWASYDKTVRLWDLATHRPLGAPLTGHERAVAGVAFSPGGKTLASSSWDQTVRLWDVATRRPLGKPLVGHEDVVVGVAFSPDGKILASTSDDKTVRLWDLATRRPLGAPLTGHEDCVVGVAFSPDGKTLASSSDDKTVRLWDVAPRRPLGAPLTGHEDVVVGVAFSPDGKTLASTSGDGTVRLWDVSTGELLGNPLTGHEDVVVGVAFSPDGKTLASTSDDKTVRLWDVSTGEPLGDPLTGHEDLVFSVAFSPDGKTLASSSDDGTVRLWDVAPRRPLGAPLAGHEDVVVGVAFSPDGKTLASSSDDKTVRLWDVSTGEPLGDPLTGHEDRVFSVAFSPDGKTLASTSGDGTVRLWDVSTGELFGAPLTGHGKGAYGVAFSPDGRTLASTSGDGTVRLWEVAPRRPLGAPLTGHEEIVFGVAFSPDGETLASSSDDKTVRLWDVSTGELLGNPLTGHEEIVFGVAFSPDGKTLASSSFDGTVRLWEVVTRRPLGAPLIGHENVVFGVAFSPDGKTLASSSWDKTVRLWEVATRRPLGAPLTGHEEIVFGVAFSPDGKTLASASSDKRVRLWDVDPDSWAAGNCALADRNLSLAEWQQYVGPDVPYRRTCPDFPPGEGAEDPSAGASP